MPSLPLVESVDQPDLLLLIAERDLPQWLSTQPAALQDWLPYSGFKPEMGKWLVLPGGAPRTVLVGTGNGAPEGSSLLWLAAGDYALAAEFGDGRDELFAAGWALGSYRFNRYRKPDAKGGMAQARLR